MNRRYVFITLLGCLACFLVGLLLGGQLHFTREKENRISGEQISDEESLTVSYTENRILPTTEYVVQKKRLNDGSVTRCSANLPESFVGMNRGEFLSAMNELKTEDTASNIVGYTVLSFSSERVVVEEAEFYPEDEQHFYLKVVGDKIVVLYGDKKTVYLETDIEVGDLPSEVNVSFLDGYSISSEKELFDILEAFSS